MLLVGKIPDRDLEILNERLGQYFGYIGVLQRFRISWTTGVTEKRITDRTPEGFQLLMPEVKELPKYDQWNQDRYVLEGLTDVPPGSDLVGKYSYEPIYTFMDKNDRPLVPLWPVCRVIIETIRHAVEHGVVKYVDPELDPKTGKDVQQARLDKIYEGLFGDESDIADALHYGEGIVVPGGK